MSAYPREIQPRLTADLPQLVGGGLKCLLECSKESMEFVVPKIFVCTYLSSCFAWSSLL